jgi:hypothetical protein
MSCVASVLPLWASPVGLGLHVADGAGGSVCRRGRRSCGTGDRDVRSLGKDRGADDVQADVVSRLVVTWVGVGRRGLEEAGVDVAVCSCV